MSGRRVDVVLAAGALALLLLAAGAVAIAFAFRLEPCPPPVPFSDGQDVPCRRSALVFTGEGWSLAVLAAILTVVALPLLARALRPR